MSHAFLSTVTAVAGEELRLLWRKRVAITGFFLLLLLTLAATFVSLQQKQSAEAERNRLQSTADQHWNAQPDRHPHRVVHYGHFVFSPMDALSFFDFGVEPYTGHAIYLEGHRQNSANFSDARQSSLLLRFGNLTPAFVLQTLVPLMIIFLAFGSVAREREGGQMRLVLCQGVSGIRLLLGKVASHLLVALALSAPAFIAVAAISITGQGPALAALLIVLGYTLYFCIWVMVSVLISAAMRRARDALLVLVGCWMIATVLLPRILPAIAADKIILPTRIETEAAIHSALAKIGDSHNPNDPYFAEFRQRTLAKYGVEKVEDLPVNYGGLLMAEGERLTSELFDRYMQADFRIQEEQSAFVNQFAILSPVIALRQLSMSLAGTSREHHAHFLTEAEKYRFDLIQALNHLHTTQVRFENDRAQRVSRHHWQDLPKFSHQPLSLEYLITKHVLPGIGILALWLSALAITLVWLGKRLERQAI